MKRILIASLLVGNLHSGGTAAQAAPADVEAINKVSKAIETNANLTGTEAEEALLNEFVRLVVTQAVWIADGQGIAKLTEVRSPAFSAHVKRMIKGQVRAAADTEKDNDRKHKWYDLLRTTSTGSAGHRALATWLDFDAPGSYLSKSKRGTAPRVTKQVQAVSSDPRLKLVHDEISLGGEVGDAGEGNGVIDAGEWVNLGLQVYNDDNRGFFSSSAWIQTQAECAWVPPALEIEMSELPAKPPEDEQSSKLSLKKKAPPTQALNAWVYLSTACPDSSVVPLQVQIKDTHRAPTSPIVLSAKMTVRNRSMAKAVNFLVDTDVPGVSDGRSMPQVSSARIFELTHGFEAPQRGLMKARTGWGIHEDVGSIISEQQAPSEPMLLAGEGSFLPGDDLDLATVKRADFDRILQARADEDRWRSLEDARAWFAADTEVSYETPDPPTEIIEPAPDEVCDNYLDDDGDGDHDCDDSDCSAEAVCNPLAPVGLAPLMSLIKSNVGIVANPATPTVSGAVDAVEPGYELVIDSDTIGAQYDCLVMGLSPDQCTGCANNGLSLADCKSCIAEGTNLRLCGLDVDCEEEKKEEAVEVDSGRDPAVVYNYRNYFTMPLGWNPIESEEFGNCKDDWDNDLDGLSDRNDPDCGGAPPPPKAKPVKKPKKPSGHRLDLGALVGRVVFTDAATIDWNVEDGSKVTAPMFNLRYVYTTPNGSPIRPVVSYAMSQSFGIAHKGENQDTVQFSAFGAGLIYHLGLGSGPLALEMRGLVNSRTHTIAPNVDSASLLSETITNQGGEAGVELHYGFDWGLGLYAGAGVLVNGAIESQGATIITTELPIVTAGLNWSIGN